MHVATLRLLTEFSFGNSRAYLLAPGNGERASLFLDEFSFENSRHSLDFTLKHLGKASFRIPCFRVCSLGEPLEMLRLL